MSSKGLRGLRHKSVGHRREAWRRKCKAAMGMEWPTITQCRDQYRKYLKAARARAAAEPEKRIRELAKTQRKMPHEIWREDA